MDNFKEMYDSYVSVLLTLDKERQSAEAEVQGLSNINSYEFLTHALNRIYDDAKRTNASVHKIDDFDNTHNRNIGFSINQYEFLYLDPTLLDTDKGSKVLDNIKEYANNHNIEPMSFENIAEASNTEMVIADYFIKDDFIFTKDFNKLSDIDNIISKYEIYTYPLADVNEYQDTDIVKDYIEEFRNNNSNEDKKVYLNDLECSLSFEELSVDDDEFNQLYAKVDDTLVPLALYCKADILTPSRDDIFTYKEIDERFGKVECTITAEQITVIKEGNPSGYYDVGFGNYLPDDDITDEKSLEETYKFDYSDLIDVGKGNISFEKEQDRMKDLKEKYGIEGTGYTKLDTTNVKKDIEKNKAKETKEYE